MTSRPRKNTLTVAILIALGLTGFIAWLSGTIVGVIVTAALAVAAMLARLLVVRLVSPRPRTAPTTAVPSPRRPIRPYLTPKELPAPPVFFAGRGAVYDEALALLRPGRNRWRRGPHVLLIEGEAGVGKSGFAIKLATELLTAMLNTDKDSGAIYASLTGAAMTERGPNGRLHNVVRDLVDSLQGPDEPIPQTYEARRTEFRQLGRTDRGRRMLYLFDDVLDEKVLAEVLPTRPDALVLVTSRSALPTLEAQRLVLQPLSAQDSDLLLRDLLGKPELDAAGEAALAKVVASAAGYPFAIHLAARAIASQGIWALPEAVAGLRPPGDQSPATGPAAAQSARDRMLDLSVAMLDPVQRQTLLSLVVLPEAATFVPWMVTVVADLSPEADEDGVADKEARNICERLADQRLLERFSTDATGVVRLRMPDGVRDYIHVRAGAELPGQVRAAAERRLDDALRDRRRRDTHKALSQTIPAAIDQGRMSAALNEARAALSDARERADNIDGLKVPGEEERRALAMLAFVLAELGGLDDALEICQFDRRARVENRDPADGPRDLTDARLRRCLGRLRRREWRLGEAIRELTVARGIAAECMDRAEEIWCLRELAIAESMRGDEGNDHVAVARGYLDDAWALLPGLPDEEFLSVRLAETAGVIRINTYHRNNDLEELRGAIRELRAAAARIPASSTNPRAWVNYHLARAMFELAANDPAGSQDDRRRSITNARQIAHQAMVAFSSCTHRYGAARCRLEIGSMYLGDGDLRAALPLLEEARETFFFCGDRWVEARTAVALARLRIEAYPELDLADAEADLDFAIPVFELAGDTVNLRLARAAQEGLAALRERELVAAAIR